MILSLYKRLNGYFFKSPELYLFVIALIFNFAAMAFLNRNPLHADAFQFNNEAINVVSGKGLINTEGTGFATTTYPTQVFFLVICKLIFGTHNYFMPVLLQHIMMAISVVLLYRICRIINFSFKVSLMSGIILLLFHNLYKSASVLNTQTLGFFLPVLFLYLCLKYKSLKYGILAGLVLGLSILTRFTYQYVPIALLVFAVLFRNTSKYPILLKGFKVFPVIIVCVLTISPWFYWVASKDSGSSGYSDAWNLVYKFNSTPDREFSTVDSLRAVIRDSSFSRAEEEAYYRNLTFNLLQHKPFNFVKNISTNTSSMLINSTWQKSTMANPYTVIFYSILLGYGILGFFVLDKTQHLKLFPMYVFSFVTYIVHIMVYGQFAHFYIFWFAFIPSISSGLVVSIKTVQKIRARRRNSSITLQ